MRLAMTSVACWALPSFVLSASLALGAAVASGEESGPLKDAAGAATAPTAARPAAPAAFPAPDEPAARDRDYPWMSLATWHERHRALVAVDASTRRGARVVFLGDSITAGWDDGVWSEAFGRFHPLRLGIGGDRTQNVLWRIADGELDGLRPAVVVLLIGTNNVGADGAPPAAAARGVATVVERVLQKLPGSRLLLLSILPFDELPNAKSRQAVAETNALLARLDDGRNVRVLDVGARLLEPDGRISPETMADFLHPTARGYRVIANAIMPLLTELLGEKD